MADVPASVPIQQRAPGVPRITRSLRIKHLLLLECLANTPSLRMAAGSLSVSQPAVTKLLAQLEQDLGVRLYLRGARGLTPTPYGEVLQRRARAMLNELGAARREITAMAEGAKGSLRIGVVVGAVPGLLTPALASLLDEQRSIDVFVIAETSANLVPRLALGELDLVVGQLPAGSDAAGFDFEQLGNEPLRLVVHPRHRLRRVARERQLEHSLSSPWVVPPVGSPQRTRLDAAIEGAGLTLPSQRIETASTLLASSLARTGPHIAVLPAEVAEHYARAGFVAVLPVVLSTDPGRIGIVTRRGGTPMPIVEALLDQLRKRAATALAMAAIAGVAWSVDGASLVISDFGLSALGMATAHAAGPVAGPIIERVRNSIGMDLVRVPAGEFMMGSDESPERLARAYPGLERQRFLDLADEAPVHRVRITRDFYLGRHEVTVAQFRQFIEASGHRPESEADGTGAYGYRVDYDPATTVRRDNFEGRDPRYSWRNTGFAQTGEDPVVNVTWNDAVAMANWLSEREGVRYRLPTEAEWEYAARAGSGTRSYAGDDPEALVGIANVYDQDTAVVWPKWRDQALSGHDGYAFTAPVGRFAPNAFGLFDTIGNVWEWTADWYASDWYARSPRDDPKGPTTGEVRVRRGGSWHTWSFYARVSFRNWNLPDTRYTLVGFRLLREMD